MDKRAKVIIKDPFRYLCNMAPECVCSYRSIDNVPKYVIVAAINGGAVLDIWSDDPKEEKQTLSFQPTGKGDAVTEAMGFAEHYQAVNSLS